MDIRSRFIFSLMRLALLGGLLLGLSLLPQTGSPAYAGSPDLAAYPWLYQRANRPLDPAEQVVELFAVGDVMLGRGVAAEPKPLAEVSAWLSAADLTMGNLEAVIAAPGIPQPGLYDSPTLSPYRLRTAPPAIDHLQTAGFDLLGLANNHAFDFGSTGLSQTVSHLEAAGITSLGLGFASEMPPIHPRWAEGRYGGLEEAALSSLPASQPFRPMTDFEAQNPPGPVIRQVGPVRLAFLAFNAVRDPAGKAAETGWHLAGWKETEAMAAITAAKAQANAVIVSIHWGQEYDLSANPAQVNVAQRMFEAGADVIVGHHPHVAQEAVVLNPDRLVAYSLGNFVFDQSFGETNQGLALRAFFDPQGLRAAQLLPLWAGPRPRLMTPDEAKPLLARVLPPRRLSFTCDSANCRPVDLIPPATSPGLFWGGEIDLTGDGIPEKVRRIQKQIVIYSHGAEVWRGDAAWRVADLALGDPNDDGRWEAILALWKPDETGVLGSHPFIIGYRKGFYRDIWGGSAVVDPIYELELGDVDGDGTQELLVLEASGQAGQRAVTVWDWHGWGFSLRWRSEPGYYRDLVFIPAGSTRPPLIVLQESFRRD